MNWTSSSPIVLRSVISVRIASPYARARNLGYINKYVFNSCKWKLFTHFFYNFCLGKSGYVKSRYCTHPAKFCFGSGQVVHVPFNPPFQRAPKVMIGLTLVDTHKDQNVRVRASVENVTSTGFKIRFSPWDVSITYQLGVNWMACPWTWIC